MQRCILALDQGTTSSRAMVLDHGGQVLAAAQQEFRQILPAPGLVEHDPLEIWQSQLATARDALAQAQCTAENVAAIGITNQRETTIVWERDTGRPVANAIVWQSRVTDPICQQLRAAGAEQLFRERTGLLLDPYFSGTKIKHLLDTVEGLRSRAERGAVLFGTVDSYLLWQLTGGRVHATDASNASRTLLLNIHTCQWDDDLLQALSVPRAMLPEVCASSQLFGHTQADLFGAPIPIGGCAGDQQAATFGQACFLPGNAKNTYGTGCFLLLNTGRQPLISSQKLLTTIGWKIGDEVTYCLEGAVFVAGAAVQWLRDGLGLARSATEIAKLAASVPDTDGVYFVPALTGLGAPYWDPFARGTIVGLTRGTTKAHLARAAIEAMAFQTRDLVEAMQQDAPAPLDLLKVDGGASCNDQLLQFQADQLGVTVRRPVVSETTALGAGYLAGLAVGFWRDPSDVTKHWVLDREFQPHVRRDEADRHYAAWKEAVSRSLKKV